MRAPFQILVIPFRRTPAGMEFAVLKRSDAEYWQFVAGGGEDDESPLQGARRESKEEVGIVGELLQLDSLSTVPKDCFAAADSWGDDVFVIPQHCFAIDAGRTDVSLSHEHTESRWVPYEKARSLLKWDSNRNALWELNERLKTPNQGHSDRCLHNDMNTFWTRFDAMLDSHEIAVDRPKGTTHPRYPAIVYPLDYGFVKGTSAGDGNDIDVWRGSNAKPCLVAVICTVDSLKNDAEIKLLVGCTPQEIETVRQFHNNNEYMSGIVVQRETKNCVAGNVG
jgi:8-oxo-dGTP pyrophosphatase MutT (NUDIX family)